MTDPLAVLAAHPRHPAAGRARGGRRCASCARSRSRPSTGIWSTSSPRTLLCACRGCFLLFESEGAGGGHFRSVPERFVAFTDFELSPTQWDSLQIPVSVAFFFLNSELGRVAAFYPGPAGATESELPLDAWARPGRGQSRPRHACSPTSRRSSSAPRVATAGGPSAYIVPIDACYELVGHLRMLWRGFDGGTEANRKLDEFFEDVKVRAR